MLRTSLQIVVLRTPALYSKFHLNCNSRSFVSLDLLVPARVVIPEALGGDGVRRLSKSTVLGRSPDVAVHHLDVVQGVVAQRLPNVASCTEPKLEIEKIIKRL